MTGVVFVMFFAGLMEASLAFFSLLSSFGLGNLKKATDLISQWLSYRLIAIDLP